MTSMHSVLLAELAALVSHHGPAMMYRRTSIAPDALTNYWVANRNRFDLWHQVMSRNRSAHQSGDWLQLQRWWQDHLIVLEEILISDMLTRVVAALAAGLDHERASNDSSDQGKKIERCDPGHGIKGPTSADQKATAAHGESDAPSLNAMSISSEDVSPITHAIHLSHLEARNRVQYLMLHNRGCRVPDAVRLNRLRKATERWTDAWLGRLSVRTPDLIRYAHDSDVAMQYAEDCHDQIRSGNVEVASGVCSTFALMKAGMNQTLRHRSHAKAALPQANRQIAESVIGMLHSEQFDGFGTLKSIGLHRIQADCTDSQNAIHNASDAPWANLPSDDSNLMESSETAEEMSRWFMAE
ncbi:MAG: hypothetical protein AAF989_06885 [Planctomycetota bacterium]